HGWPLTCRLVRRTILWFVVSCHLLVCAPRGGAVLLSERDIVYAIIHCRHWRCLLLHRLLRLWLCLWLLFPSFRRRYRLHPVTAPLLAVVASKFPYFYFFVLVVFII